MSTEEVTRCPWCGGELVVDSDGTLICSVCGAIVDELMIDQTYGQKPPGRSQTGPQHVKSRHIVPTSVIDKETKQLMTPDSSSRLKNFKTILDHCTTLLKQLGVQIDDTQRMLLERYIMQVLEKGTEEGKQIRRTSAGAVAAAIVHVFLRKIGKPKSIKIIQKLAVDKFKIAKNSRQISRAIHLVERLLGEPRFASAEQFVLSLGSELNLGAIIIRVAQAVCKLARLEHLTLGKAPNGIAAGAISITYKYLEGRQIRSLLARVAGVSDVTIRYRETELEENPRIRRFLQRVSELYRKGDLDSLYAFIEEYLKQAEAEVARARS